MKMKVEAVFDLDEKVLGPLQEGEEREGIEEIVREYGKACCPGMTLETVTVNIWKEGEV